MFLQASSLFLATTIVDFTAMAVTLWLAFYLFARGFPNKITLRTVVVLLAISIFYLSAYKNIFHQTVGTASWRAVCLIIGMAFWYSVTYHLMSKQSQRRFRMVSYGMYGFAFLTAILILMDYWRRTASFRHRAWDANVVLMTAGLVLFGYQLAGYFLIEGA